MSNYRVGQWYDKPNYECELCAYSTLSEGTMEHHQATAHIVFPDPTPAVGGVVAPFVEPVLVGESGPEQIQFSKETSK